MALEGAWAACLHSSAGTSSMKEHKT
jgi:hypothetical protein